MGSSLNPLHVEIAEIYKHNNEKIVKTIKVAQKISNFT